MHLKSHREYIEEKLNADIGLEKELRLAEAEVQLAQRLLDLREELGLTQRKAAERIDIKAPHLSRLEGSGAIPTLQTIWKLADAYGAYFTFGPRYFVGAEFAAGWRNFALTDIRAHLVESNSYGMLEDFTYKRGSELLAASEAWQKATHSFDRNSAPKVSPVASDPQSVAA